MDFYYLIVHVSLNNQKTKKVHAGLQARGCASDRVDLIA